MSNHLLEFIKIIQNNQDLRIYDEASTKQAVILPILAKLNWDIFNRNEVFPEYTTENKRVDYSLRIMESNKVFIEAKRVSEDLENHTRQLLNYSFQEGVSLAVLTNGISWWFYLPLNELNWEQRKFLTIELYEQEAVDIASRLTEFLSRENVENGRSIESALKIFKGKQRDSKIQKTLPKAWQKIINEPDELFIEILTETTEKLCGYQPDLEAVENFVKEFILSRFAETAALPIRLKPPKPPKIKPINRESNYKDGERFILKYKGLTAIGVKVGNGIRIQKGSQATFNVLESLKNHYFNLRTELINTRVLSRENDGFIFITDYRFESFSAAASIICGSSRNGLNDFKKL